MDLQEFTMLTLDQILQANTNTMRIASLAKEGGRIISISIAHRGDTEYQKSVPVGSENNSLGNPPSFSTPFQEHLLSISKHKTVYACIRRRRS